MKNQLYLLLCLSIVACNSKPKTNDQRDSTKTNTVRAAYSGPFDLATLKLNENLPDLMAAQAINTEPKTEQDKTLIGFEVFKSSEPKTLRFENADLSGGKGNNKNYVLFHYNEEKKTLRFYEVVLYSQAQTDTLINLLGKVGTIVFKQTKLAKGSLEIDENGNAVKPGTSPGKTFRVWENKSTGLSYFLMGTGSGSNFNARLIVLKRSEQAGKDWISNLSLDWYQNTKSEPL